MQRLVELEERHCKDLPEEGKRARRSALQQWPPRLLPEGLRPAPAACRCGSSSPAGALLLVQQALEDAPGEAQYGVVTAAVGGRRGGSESAPQGLLT